ncbi:NAD-dependent epimerase/dehydratase family protein [Agrococcus jejuensis]|uniref:NAD-dependent epimerase/dehydratase family protein n=1 Tax=Agrococcus jejuensis TaxID=399736 RepID=UPI0011A4098D|nr:NAD-dependent epimerase/dehydratase family protein [Agrococcus jejuensis]
MSAPTTLLVTGGAGFIGSHVVEAALARGWRVRVLDSLRRDVHGDGGMRVPEQEGLEVVVADVARERAVAAALDGVDVVCHLAAKVGLGVDFRDAADYVASNVGATAVLLQAMREAQVRRLVLASSMVVYGEGAYRDAEGPLAVPPRAAVDLEAGRFEPISPRTGEPVEPELVDESAPSDPRNVYAASKLAQEHLAAAWARGGDGTAALLRFHNVYGPHMPMGTPYAGVASLFRSALERGEAPRVFEDGRQRRDFVHVRDVADANLAAADWTADAPAGSARAFNVGSGVVHTIGEMATALADAFGGPAPIVTGEYRLGDVRHVTASSQRAADELGWRAAIDFDAGMQEFAHAPQRPPASEVGA